MVFISIFSIDHGDIVWPLEDDHLSDSQGIHTYRPYGNTDYETDNWDENNPFGTFTGKENDRIPTGDHGWGDYNMMDFGARHYLPHLAVFASPDPVSGDPANPLSWNRYAYCVNNPVRYVDPDSRLIFDFQEVKRDFNIVRAAGKEGTGYLLPALTVARTAGGVADDILLATGVYGIGKQIGKLGAKQLFKGFGKGLKNLFRNEGGFIRFGKGTLKNMSLKEAKALLSRWDKSTYDTLAESLRDHAVRHGFGDDIAKYLRKAANFNKRDASKVILDNGATRWNRKSGEFLIERGGKIVSCFIWNKFMKNTKEKLLISLVENIERKFQNCKQDRKNLHNIEWNTKDISYSILGEAEVSTHAVIGIVKRYLRKRIEDKNDVILILKKYSFYNSNFLLEWLMRERNRFPDFAVYIDSVEHLRLVITEIISEI